jgi:hypothetical protein
MKFTLKRYKINSSGYSSTGYYYGVGLPLYWYCSQEKIDGALKEGVIRARNRKDAKAQVIAKYPGAKFYN